MRDFEYLEPTTLSEACSLLSQYGDAAKVIAGGNALLIMMKQRLLSPRYLVSINQVPGLDTLVYDEGKGLRMGCLVNHRAIETSPLVRERFGILSEMAQHMANVRVRNQGTIGGNLCHAEPHADPPPLLLALNAGVKAVSPKGERTLPLEDFFVDYYENALEVGEILAEIQVPSLPPRTGCSYQRLTTRSYGDRPCLVAAMVLAMEADLETCRDARIVLGAVAPTPLRAKGAEGMIRGKRIEDRLIKQASERASEEAKPLSDLYGSEWYKREMVKVLVRRGVQEALQRVKGPTSQKGG